MYLPLTNNPEETFKISIYDIVYNFRQLWCALYSAWSLDISDFNGDILVYGVKIITKEYILKQYAQVPFDLYSDNDSDPSRNNLNAFLLTVSDKNV